MYMYYLGVSMKILLKDKFYKYKVVILTDMPVRAFAHPFTKIAMPMPED